MFGPSEMAQRLIVCVFCLLCAAGGHCALHDTPSVPPPLQEPPHATTLDPHNAGDSAQSLRGEMARQLLATYGDGHVITLEGFEKLLGAIGLERLVGARSDSSTVPTASNVSSVNARVSPPEGNQTKPLKANNTQQHQCEGSTELFAAFSGPLGTSISETGLSKLCPSLLYRLAVPPDPHLACTGIGALAPDTHDEPSTDQSRVWLYSTISILVISLCGLLGVAVIPIMQKVFYQQLLQYLVALAVGTLCGDALLHLLPHAMVSPSESHHHGSEEGSEGHSPHTSIMWKGLVAAMGLVFFFFMEKCLTMIAEWRKCRQRRQKVPSRVRVMRDADQLGDTAVGEKLCKHKYSSYPYCYDEITADMAAEGNNQNHHHKNHPHQHPTELLPTAKLPALKHHSNGSGGDSKEDMEENGAPRAETECGGACCRDPSEAESYTVIIREHGNQHHGHSHTHGHVHAAPESFSSVVWMVVMGDGLHNFTDGMAIGAAFAASLAGGFSTAVAVFCHELPHELGDFAVLLKAGMSAKQAVFYNLLSSVLCLFGMVLGVMIGHSEEATSWVFAAAAGMFLYIALVDMTPELTSTHPKEGGSLCQCLLQMLGLITGIGIMMVIALYEHDLKQVFKQP